MLSDKNTTWTFRRSSRPAMSMRNVCPRLPCQLCPPVFQFWLRYCILLRSVVMFANVVNRRFFIQPQTSVCHLMLSSMLQWRVWRLVRCTSSCVSGNTDFVVECMCVSDIARNRLVTCFRVFLTTVILYSLQRSIAAAVTATLIGCCS